MNYVVLGRFRTNPKLLKACDCRTPCHDIKYSAVTSSLKFPNSQYTAMNIRDDGKLTLQRASYCQKALLKD